MNKNRMILVASGGVIGLAVLVMAYLTWSAYSAKVAAIEGDDEGTDGLETVLSKAQTLSRKPVYPCAASVKALDANTTRLTDWCAEAQKLASHGDRPVRTLTPAQFKTDLVMEAKRLAALPGAVNGVLVKPDFAFGPFRSYIAEGKMPTEAELGELQRRWDDVMLLVETMSACGIAELVNVDFKAEKKEEVEAADAKKKGKAKGKAKVKAKAKGEEKAEPVAYSYVFTFTARPAAYVKVMNALTTNERFMVIDDFTLARSADPIGEALGGAEKKETSNASSGRGRRGRRAAAVVEQPKAEEKNSKNGIVTDPLLDAPFTVTLSVTVYDFKTMEETPKAEEVGK